MNIPSYGPQSFNQALPPHGKTLNVNAPYQPFFPALSNSSGYAVNAMHDVYTIIGQPFFTYAQERSWSPTGTKRQYLLRVAALVHDIIAAMGSFEGMLLDESGFKSFSSPITGRQIIVRNQQNQYF